MIASVSVASQSVLAESVRSSSPLQDFSGTRGGVPEKLKHWLEKLCEVLTKVVG
jgi:hypothetical protein